MAHRTDLYSILISYANKHNSPYISIDPFLDFLEQYAKSLSAENPEWLKWAKDKTVKFWAEMSALTEEGKCELLADTSDGRVYLSNFYPFRIQKAYNNVEENVDLPFHSEEYLKMTLPESHVRALNCSNDLLSYLAEPQEADIPILRITFPDGFASAIVLASMIPRRLTEIAIGKIRNYLRKGGNKEYMLRKLMPQLQGRETSLKDQFNWILLRPHECYNAIIDGGEFSCLFWAHFCTAMKSDIKKKKECLHEEVAAIQSVYIIETISGYYKTLAVKRREMEQAFKSLEVILTKPPFLYTLDQICKFTNPKGILLLSQYTKDELQEWLKKKTTESENNALPVLLIVRGVGDERFFVYKDKMPALCVKHLTTARVQVKETLAKHWRKLLLDYDKEPAMESNDEFEKTLFTLTKKNNPLLTTLLEDPKLSLVYDEIEQSANGLPAPARIFTRGQLLPYSSLLLIQRKELLSDAKLMLPLWYSLPILSAITAFFKNLSRKKKAARLSPPVEEDTVEDILEERDRGREIRTAAQKLESVLIPDGHNMESYMEELENRWSKLIDKQARKNLIEDVRSLIKDNLRRMLRVKKHLKITRETLSQLAQNIVSQTPSLAALSGRDSLVLYAELYLIKLMRNIK